MKILVVGLGSMGKRRIRNLQALAIEDVIGFDERSDRCRESQEKYGVQVFAGFEAALAQQPDALVISTPPNRHRVYALQAAQAGKSFFSECNFLSSEVEDLLAIEEDDKLVAAPSFTMPHHPAIKILRQLLAEGTVGCPLFFTYHLASYLPQWHPWEDYRQVYYAQPQTPGCKEMVAFELTWLTWLFGRIRKVVAVKGKVSSLETPIDDIYQIVLEFECGLRGSLLVEVVSGHHDRHLELYGTEGTITWESAKELVQLYDLKTKKHRDFPEPIMTSAPGYNSKTHEEMYIEEMNDFVKALRGEKKYPYSFHQEKEICELVAAIDRSAETGTAIKT